MNNKHITFFFTGFIRGGGERMMTLIARELSARGHDVTFLMLYTSDHYRNLPNDIVIKYLGAKTMTEGLRLLRGYFQKHPDTTVLVTQEHAFITASFARLFVRKNIRIVMRIGSPPSLLFKKYSGIKDGIVVPFLFKGLLHFADAVITVSKEIGEEVKRYGVREEKIIPIYNPLPRSMIIEKSNIPVSDEWLRNEKRPIVAFVGRIEKGKGADILLESLADIMKRHDIVGLFVGDGGERVNLKAKSVTLGISKSIHFVGHAENPYQYMKCAHILALPSEREGFPNVLAEALALQIPSIATDCLSGPREIFAPGTARSSITNIEYAEFGVLVPEASGSLLTEAIERLLIDKTLWKKYQTNALVRAKDFDQADSIGKYEKVLTSLNITNAR